jgi:hypothetical protein
MRPGCFGRAAFMPSSEHLAFRQEAAATPHPNLDPGANGADRSTRASVTHCIRCRSDARKRQSRIVISAQIIHAFALVRDHGTGADRWWQVGVRARRAPHGRPLRPRVHAARVVNFDHPIAAIARSKRRISPSSSSAAGPSRTSSWRLIPPGDKKPSMLPICCQAGGAATISCTSGGKSRSVHLRTLAACSSWSARTSATLDRSRCGLANRGRKPRISNRASPERTSNPTDTLGCDFACREV